MTIIFAGTGYWIALLNPQDNLHQRAALLTASLTSAKIVTSEMVFTEVLNAFSKRGDFLKQSAVTLIQGSARNPNVTVVPQTSALFQAAFDLYSQRLDQSWRHTDCASFCIMQQRSLQEALAYDRHFEQAGFTALLR